MFTYRNLAILGLALIVLGGLIIAKPDFTLVSNETDGNVLANVLPSQGHATVSIPSHALEISPGVFFLGTTMSEGKMIEGYAFIDYKQGFAKPSGCNYDGKCTGWEDAGCSDCTGSVTTVSTCYSFLAKGAKWRVNEPYVVNTDNIHSLGGSQVSDIISKSVEKWETAAGFEIFGQGSLTNQSLEADSASPDGKNELFFGAIEDRNAIAITIVWGIFRGPPSQRELIEWDMVFDQEDFAWDDSGAPGAMDFEAIATHELGHSTGLDDLYDAGCAEETMYGYATEGETKKRSLESGDKAGVKELYS